MKSLLAIIALVLAPLQVHAAFSLFAHSSNTGCTITANTCAITVAPNPGQLIVVSLTSTISNTISSVSDDGSPASSYSLVSASACSAAGAARSTDCAYALSAGSSITTITVTRNNSTSATWTVAAEVFSFTGFSVIFGTASNAIDSVSQTTHSTPALTKAGLNAVILQVLKTNAITVSSIGAPYTAVDCTLGTNNHCRAYQLNDPTLPTVNWTTASNSTSSSSAVAFYELSTQPVIY